MPILIGTSGWQYRHWRGALYPPDLPQQRWLEHYAGQYATVENDSTFYRLPARETFADWKARTPEDFVMAIKASRFLTHVKRLQDPAEPVQRLMRAAAGLGDRLGPVLLQLPPNLTADVARLDDCLTEFGKSEAGEAGPGRGGAAAPVLVDRGDPAGARRSRRRAVLGGPARPSGGLRSGGRRTGDTSDFTRARRSPWPRYGARALRSWLDRVTAHWPDSEPVYVYFNNDQFGAAVADSAAFARLSRRASRRAGIRSGR